MEVQSLREGEAQGCAGGCKHIEICSKKLIITVMDNASRAQNDMRFSNSVPMAFDI